MDDSVTNTKPNPTPAPEPISFSASPEPPMEATNQPDQSITTMPPANTSDLPKKHRPVRKILIIVGIIIAILAAIVVIAAVVMYVFGRKLSPVEEAKVGGLTVEYPVNIWNEADSEITLDFGVDGDKCTLKSSVYGYLTFAYNDFGQVDQYLFSDLSGQAFLAGTGSALGMVNMSAVTTVSYGGVLWNTITGRLDSMNSDVGLWVYYDTDAGGMYAVIYQSPIGHYDTYFEYAVKDVLESIVIAEPTGVINNPSDYDEDNEKVLGQGGVKGNYTREIFSGHEFEYTTDYDTAVFGFKNDGTFTVKYRGGDEYNGTYEVYNGLYISLKANEIAEDTSIDHAEELARDVKKVADQMMDDASSIVSTYLLWLRTNTGVIQPFVIRYDDEKGSGVAVNILGRTQGSFEMK